MIALPSHLHAPAAAAAMKAGLHVFTETPMALRVADAKEMARLAKEKNLCLAVGQQRCYSFLYDNAFEMVRKGLLSDVHYIRAQWHVAKDGKKSEKKVDWWRETPKEDADLNAQDHGYASVEESGPLAAPGKAQRRHRHGVGISPLRGRGDVPPGDADSRRTTAFPLSVAASAGQLLPAAEGDVDDHVSCVFEYAVAGYVDKGPRKAQKKIGMQFDLIVGNEFDGYGETVLGKHGSLVLDREQCGMLYRTSDVDKKIRVLPEKDKQGKVLGGVVLDVPRDAAKAGDEESAAIGQLALSGADPGFAAELEHWAWCVRNPAAKTGPVATPRRAWRPPCLPSPSRRPSPRHAHRLRKGMVRRRQRQNARGPPARGGTREGMIAVLQIADSGPPLPPGEGWGEGNPVETPPFARVPRPTFGRRPACPAVPVGVGWPA